MTPSSPESATRGRVDGEVDREPLAKRQRRGTNDYHSYGSSNRRQAACQPCRLRKIKCDKLRPFCGLCQISGQPCEYVGEAHEKLSLETATAKILDRFDQLRQEFDHVKAELSSRNCVPIKVQSNTERCEADKALDSAQTLLRSPSVEASRDFLQIPPRRASADSVLQWEIFDGKYPANALINVLFSPDHNVSLSGGTASNPNEDLITKPSGLTPLDEEQIPSLIDRFLQNVHTKNPILDVEALVKHGRKCAEQGVGWDGRSCLVLVACALGSVAKPFDRSVRPSTTSAYSSVSEAGASGMAAISSAKLYAKELQQGDSCFTLACRRLGSLKYSMLGAQCHFFAGVYLMYTLRPMLSWHYFMHASIFCQMYLKMTHGLSGNFTEVLGAPSQRLTSTDRKSRRLEQSLYWSCFKSECEFRVELPIQQSEISLGEYPDLFPFPPSPVVTKNQVYPSAASMYGSCPPQVDEETELRRHAARLCNEEESWYYYLTEIALRRIGNRIVNTFFRQHRTSWLNIKPIIRMAREFEAQVSSWSAHLPPAMQHYETTFIIRAPQGNPQGAGGHVSRELSWALDNRLLEMQTWLYQPIFYYFIHVTDLDMIERINCSMAAAATGQQPRISTLLNPFSPPSVQAPSPAVYVGPSNLSGDELDALRSLLASGIDCLLKTIDVRAHGHRHHGLWYDLRSIMCASLILLALVKSENDVWIPGGARILWGEPPSPEYWTGTTPPVGGKIGKVLRQFDFWADESPDLLKYKEVLESVLRDVRSTYIPGRYD